LALLEDLKPSYEGEFTHFAEMGLVGVQAATELPAEAAALALQRDFAEPVQWLGSIERKAQFIRSCEAQGAHVLQGGRFLHVGGAADKGLAARWLCEAFVAAGYPTPKTIGLGDSHNDVALLNAMDQAVIVRGVKSEALQLSLPAERVTKTEQWGPVGWCAAMEAFLEGEAL
jgi:predicted mannosyl-3-phosphoglycerate phosphatase (HAD superfamily)